MPDDRNVNQKPQYAVQLSQQCSHTKGGDARAVPWSGTMRVAPPATSRHYRKQGRKGKETSSFCENLQSLSLVQHMLRFAFRLRCWKRSEWRHLHQRVQLLLGQLLVDVVCWRSRSVHLPRASLPVPFFLRPAPSCVDLYSLQLAGVGARDGLECLRLGRRGVGARPRARFRQEVRLASDTLFVATSQV